jgi:hypothetical protein
MLVNFDSLIKMYKFASLQIIIAIVWRNHSVNNFSNKNDFRSKQISY